MKLKLSDINIKDNVRKGEVKASPSLVKSIERVGLLTPIAVSKNGDGYTLVAGERRYAAHLELGLKTIEATVVEPESQAQRIEMQVTENQQREGLTHYELMQAAWDLKAEGLKQGEVAEALLIGTKDVSRLHKMAKEINKHDEVDEYAETLRLLDLEDLEQLAVQPEGRTVPLVDIMRYYNEQDPDTWRGRDIRDAQDDALIEILQAEYIDAIADELNMLAEKGVSVLERDPTFAPTKDGSRVRNKSVARIGKVPKTPLYEEREAQWLDLPLDTHVLEECHAIWVDTPTSKYRLSNAEPKVIHFCVKMENHAKAGKSEVKAKQVDQKQKVKASESEQRKADNAARRLRFAKAGLWVGTAKVAEANALAYQIALTTLRSDDYMKFNQILGTAKERPKGAGYDWHANRFEQYMEEKFGDDQVKRARFVVQLLAAKRYATAAYGYRNPEVDAAIEAMEVPTDE